MILKNNYTYLITILSQSLLHVRRRYTGISDLGHFCRRLYLRSYIVNRGISVLDKRSSHRIAGSYASIRKSGAAVTCRITSASPLRIVARYDCTSDRLGRLSYFFACRSYPLSSGRRSRDSIASAPRVRRARQLKVPPGR